MFAGLREAGRPWTGLVFSISAHVLVVGLAWGLAGEMREAERQEARDRARVEQMTASRERKWVVWYPQRKSLPEVSPVKPFGPGKTAQGEKSPETVVAQADRAESRRQFVYRPDRPQRLKTDVEAANLVAAPDEAWKEATPALPSVEKSIKARRQFEGLQQARRPGQAADLAVSEDLLKAAESIKGTGAQETQLGRAGKARRQFDARGLEGARPRGVQAGDVVVSDDVLKAAEGVKDASAEAKGIAGLQASRAAKPAARKFDGLPARRGAASGSANAAMVEAPEVSGQAVAVVGLNPGPRLVTPEGSRGGQFARAPVEGEASSGPGGSGVKVPGLMAKGSPTAAGAASGAPSGGAAVAAVPDRRKMQELAVPPVARTLSAPLRAGARVVPPLIEGVFSGRSVYTLVVPDIKVAGYQGDWVIWFGGRDVGEGRMGAPYPAAKALVDGTVAAGDGRPAFVQFGAVIGSDGRLSRVRVLKTRADDAVKTRALLELQTWAFRPATLNGLPVEVDAVIEVTFVF